MLHSLGFGVVKMASLLRILGDHLSYPLKPVLLFFLFVTFTDYVLDCFVSISTQSTLTASCVFSVQAEQLSLVFHWFANPGIRGRTDLLLTRYLIVNIIKLICLYKTKINVSAWLVLLTSKWLEHSWWSEKDQECKSGMRNF